MQMIERIGVAVLVFGLPVFAGASQPQAGTMQQETWATLTKVDAKNGTFTAKGLISTRTFHAGDNCSVVAVDKKEAELSDLRPGEKVRIRYQGLEGVLVADRVVEKALHYRGTVQGLDPKAVTVTMERKELYRTVPVHKTMRIARDRKVILTDGKEGMVSDLKPGDRVAVIYELPDGTAMAYRIRQESATFVGTVDTINLPDRTLTAKNRLSEKEFDLAPRCEIVLNGREHADLKNLAPGQKYRFTYETLNGLNVVNYIAPA